MKKYLYSLMAVMFAAFSFTLTSCGDDDDEPNEPGIDVNSININGVTYPVATDLVTMEGVWNSQTKEGKFTVSINDHGDIWYYTFHYESNSLPKVGDDFSKMSVTLEPLDGSDAPLWTLLPYKSGSAVVTAIDPAKETMIVNFANFTCEGSGYSYTFTGTPKVSFDFR